MEESCNQNYINEHSSHPLLMLYPVPVNSISITIVANNVKIRKVVILTILGEKIYHVDINSSIQSKVILKLPDGLLRSENYIIKVVDIIDQSYFHKISAILIIRDFTLFKNIPKELRQGLILFIKNEKPALERFIKN